MQKVCTRSHAAHTADRFQLHVTPDLLNLLLKPSACRPALPQLILPSCEHRTYGQLLPFRYKSMHLYAPVNERPMSMSMWHTGHSNGCAGMIYTCLSMGPLQQLILLLVMICFMADTAYTQETNVITREAYAKGLSVHISTSYHIPEPISNAGENIAKGLRDKLTGSNSKKFEVPHGHIDANNHILIVQIKPTANIDTVLKRLGYAAGKGLARKYRIGSRFKGFSIKIGPGQEKARCLQGLMDDPDVILVNPDGLSYASQMYETTKKPACWGLDRIDQRTLPLTNAYNHQSDGGAGVYVYVLDTGINEGHQDFQGRVVEGWASEPGYNPSVDDHGHGTHCAGTIGGASYGVAKQVQLVPVKVLYADGQGGAMGANSGIAAGVSWVVDDTRVLNCRKIISMSLSGPGTSVLDEAVAAAVAAGVTVVVAAGNENVDACLQSPARAADAITVGATDKDDIRAEFSNFGSCVALFAPGVEILSAGHASATDSATMDGTSMACPHVAGAAAVVAATDCLTPGAIRAALLSAATMDKVTDTGENSPNLLLFTGVECGGGEDCGGDGGRCEGTQNSPDLPTCRGKLNDGEQCGDDRDITCTSGMCAGVEGRSICGKMDLGGECDRDVECRDDLGCLDGVCQIPAQDAALR